MVGALRPGTPFLSLPNNGPSKQYAPAASNGRLFSSPAPPQCLRASLHPADLTCMCLALQAQ
jgi:hypothetical protein